MGKRLIKAYTKPYFRETTENEGAISAERTVSCMGRFFKWDTLLRQSFQG